MNVEPVYLGGDTGWVKVVPNDSARENLYRWFAIEAEDDEGKHRITMNRAALVALGKQIVEALR